jgi:hypothetical protein
VIAPHEFIRLVTLALGFTWSVVALIRMVRLERRWRERLDFLDAGDAWWRRQVVLACLRTTVLDPVNQALLWLLLALWTLAPR